MSHPLKGKAALVTGGSRGIGAAIAERLAQDGAKIAITYARSAEAAQSVVDAIKAEGGEAIAIQADAADPVDNEAAVRKVKETFGRLDILVNNAGVFELGPIGELTAADYASTFDVNVRGVFAATNEAAKHLEDGGRIINTGSVIADRTFMPTLSLYAGSKAAVKAFTKAWARDLGERNITVNVIQPGPIDTEMNPADGDGAGAQAAMTALGRYGQAKEIADAAAFLASPDASFITGAVLDIDGGIRL